MIITAVYLYGVMFAAVEPLWWFFALCFAMDMMIASGIGD